LNGNCLLLATTFLTTVAAQKIIIRAQMQIVSQTGRIGQDHTLRIAATRLFSWRRRQHDQRHLNLPETDSDRIPCGFRAPHSDRSDETIKGKQSEFYMAVTNFSDQISELEQLAILKFDFFRYLYI
jgi:hypothetical protein